MYYTDYERVKKIEKWLERLAYISVVLDFFIALASFLVLRGDIFSSLMLSIAGDLIMVEMIIIGVLFVTLVALKHYNNILGGFALATFKNRQMRNARHTFRKIIINPVILMKRLITRLPGLG